MSNSNKNGKLMRMMMKMGTAGSPKRKSKGMSSMNFCKRPVVLMNYDNLLSILLLLVVSQF